MKILSILTTYYLQTKRNLKRCNLGHILNFLPCFLGETENPIYYSIIVKCCIYCNKASYGAACSNSLKIPALEIKCI